MMERRFVVGGLLAAVIDPTVAGAQSASVVPGGMKFRMTFGGQTMTATLENTEPVRELLSMLPLNLKIEDYSKNEKIAYLPRKLTSLDDRPFGNELPGDVAYYAPWGNLVFYHGGYRYSRGLIRLGRFEDGFQPLLTRGEYPLQIQAM